MFIAENCRWTNTGFDYDLYLVTMEYVGGRSGADTEFGVVYGVSIRKQKLIA